MKKKILIHSIAFSPDGVSTAYLYNDIALKFSLSGFEVVVLTTTPHYNPLKKELIKQPLKKKWFGLYYESWFHNIKVLHVPQKKHKNSVVRMIGFLYWHVVAFFLSLRQKEISLILSPSPPLTIGLINILVAKVNGAKVIYNVQEIYPDFLINRGLKFKPVINALKTLERYVYNKSDAIVTIDSVFYNNLYHRFKDPSKLSIIHNFVDTELYKPVDENRADLDHALYPLKSKILKVMYAGNIGHAQDWLLLIEICKDLKEIPVEFWVIGEGVMKPYLKKEIQKFDLTNIHLVEYQNREEMPGVIAYADLHFIFMTPGMDGQGFPSKVYTIMACAKPLLVVSGAGTPIINFLKPVNCSFLIESNDIKEKVSSAVRFLKNAITNKKELEEMGKRGYEIIEKQYSKNVVTQLYVDLADKIHEQ